MTRVGSRAKCTTGGTGPARIRPNTTRARAKVRAGTGSTRRVGRRATARLIEKSPCQGTARHGHGVARPEIGTTCLTWRHDPSTGSHSNL
ncbi:hypothetical protein KSS87_015704 [Heliosperma pusillum]|nr:hypothetical protein KSS87_015704 [Heliosperma pusillum]